MKTLLIFLFAILMASCQEHQPQMDNSAAISEIQTIMKKQEDAWNRGDLEGFMLGYWKSDSLRFIGKRGITYGWQQTLDNYKKGYPNTEAMGTLQFTNLSLELTGDSAAYVIGQWQLFRTADTLSGHYSLLWKMKNNQWLIVADHSS
jgi:ketosteroid isomerase-like protein